METEKMISEKSFIGLTEIAGRTSAKLNGIKFFVFNRDGNFFLRTQNVDPNRLNVRVYNDIIQEAYYG